MNVLRTLRDDESGITLIELVIYMVLAALFLTIVSAIFVNGWLTQAATADRDAATGTAGLVSASLQQSVRNASAISPQSGDSNFLVAVVANGASGDWQCRAWVRLDNGDLRYTTSSTRIDPSSAGDYSSSSTWSTLASGIGLLPRDPSNPTVLKPMFSITTPTNVTYSFASARSKESVPVAGGVTVQAVIPGGGPCW